MAKFVASSVQDLYLAGIAAATEYYACNGQPTSRADAIARQSAAVTALTPADFSAPTTGAAGVRQITVVGKMVTATVNQTTDHVALCSGTTLLLVTTIPTPGAVSPGGTLTIGSFVESLGPIA